jgi:hypothetical protein
MKLVTFYLIWILLSISNLISGQKVEKDQIPVFKLLECTDKKELKLSDLVSNMRLVKLETKDSSMIGPNSRFIVGAKYIICTNQKNILQFDSNGKFIRIIAMVGRGPEEFVNINGIDMDKEEKNLFFTSRSSKMINVVDLITGKFGTPIPVSNGDSAPKIVIKSNKVSILPTITGNEKYFLYYQNFTGKFIEGIPVTYKSIPQMNINSITPPVSHGDLIYYYEPKVCGDTLFKVNGVLKTPVAIVSGGNIFGLSMASASGYTTTLLSKIADSWLFSNLFIDMSNNSLNIKDTHFYILDDKNSRLSEINEFTLDKLGKTYLWEEIKKGLFIDTFDWSREQFVLKIEAIDFKKIISANKLNLPENEMKQIKKLDQEITIYDNPVLLIGKLK